MSWSKIIFKAAWMEDAFVSILFFQEKESSLEIGGCEIPGYVIVVTSANFRGEINAALDDLSPLLFRKVGKILAMNVILQQSQQNARIEIVSGANRTDRFDRRNIIMMLAPAGVKVYPFVSMGADKAVAIKLDMFFVNEIHIRLTVNIEEILVGTPYDIGKFEVVHYCRPQPDSFMGMGFAKIRIVINNSLPFFCVLQELRYRIPQYRV